MIRFLPQQRIQEGFAGRLLSPALWLDGNKDSVNLSEFFRIFQAKNPAAVRFAVHVQDAEIHRAFFLARLGISLSPDLESACTLDAGLVIEVKSVKDQRFALSVKDTAKGLAGAAATVHIKDIRNIKLSCSHQFANVTV